MPQLLCTLSAVWDFQAYKRIVMIKKLALILLLTIACAPQLQAQINWNKVTKNLVSDSIHAVLIGTCFYAGTHKKLGFYKLILAPLAACMLLKQKKSCFTLPLNFVAATIGGLSTSEDNLSRTIVIITNTALWIYFTSTSS